MSKLEKAYDKLVKEHDKLRMKYIKCVVELSVLQVDYEDLLMETQVTLESKKNKKKK